MVLIIKNIRSEGPGTILDFLIERGIHYRMVEMGDGEEPPHIDDYETVIIMGGPMAVYEMDLYPFLKTLEKVINESIKKKKKVLGICLGAQMIAHCLGARVYKGEIAEIGWHDIELTPQGLLDPCMNALSRHPRVGDVWKRFKVFHWHGDTFDLPRSTVRLAISSLYENQAFRAHDNIYALQFHIEVNRLLLDEWFRDDPSRDGILESYDSIHTEYTGRAMQFYSRFFNICS